MGVLYSGSKNDPRSLLELCQYLCPAIDVNLFVVEAGAKIKAVGANDWMSIDGKVLLERMLVEYDDEKWPISEEERALFRENAAKNLRLIKNTNGDIVGRANITVGYGISQQDPRLDLRGVVTIGGLRACGLTGICGILEGYPVRASRDAAKPIVADESLWQWAEEQTELVPDLWQEPEQQAACAQYIRLCGGATKNLPIARNQGRWISATEIERMSSPPETIVILDDLSLRYELSTLVG
jgi:hypothetical protein